MISPMRVGGDMPWKAPVLERAWEIPSRLAEELAIECPITPGSKSFGFKDLFLAVTTDAQEFA
jgi:hypothetical protein